MHSFRVLFIFLRIDHQICSRDRGNYDSSVPSKDLAQLEILFFGILFSNLSIWDSQNMQKADLSHWRFQKVKCPGLVVKNKIGEHIVTKDKNGMVTKNWLVKWTPCREYKLYSLVHMKIIHCRSPHCKVKHQWYYLSWKFKFCLDSFHTYHHTPKQLHSHIILVETKSHQMNQIILCQNKRISTY